MMILVLNTNFYGLFIFGVQRTEDGGSGLGKGVRHRSIASFGSIDQESRWRSTALSTPVEGPLSIVFRELFLANCFPIFSGREPIGNGAGGGMQARVRGALQVRAVSRRM